MKVDREDLSWAVSRGLLSAEQGEALWTALKERTAGQQRFDAIHVAYYFGALIVIGAMGWFMNEAWESFGGGGLFLVAAIYATCFVLAGRTLWDKEGLQVPGGLLFTMAVCMTPLGIYGLERWLGIWPQGDPGAFRDYHIWVKGSWLLMEAGTILAGLIALRYRRFPFLTAPIAFSLWYMSMDLTPLLFGRDDFSWEERQWVSLWFGLVVLLVTYLADLRSRGQDLSFWGYLFGLISFWGGLTLMDSDSEWSKFFYLLINGGLIVASLVLRQRVFIVFGAIGVLGYIGHLSYEVFKDSLLFPFVLTLVGIAIIYLGVLLQRHRERIEGSLHRLLPEALRRLVPPRARAAME